MTKIFIIILVLVLLVVGIFSFLPSQCHSNNSHNSNINVLNLQGDSVNLNKLINYDKLNIVILLSLPTCHECCVQLNTALTQLIEDKANISIYAIISSDNDVLSRRMDMNYFKKFFSLNIQYYFVTTNSNNYSGSFGICEYKITHTPSLLLMSFNKELFVNYEELFGNNEFTSQKLFKIINDFK
jgi:hypothetical protein